MVQTEALTDQGPSTSKHSHTLFPHWLLRKWRVTLGWMRTVVSAGRHARHEDQYLLQTTASVSSVSTTSSIHSLNDVICKSSCSSINTETTDIANSAPAITSWRRKRPYLVEAPLFLYYIAYKACLPLQEQFVFALVAANYLIPDDDYSVSSEGRESSCLSNATGETPIDLIHDAIQRESSHLLCYFNIVKCVPALFSTFLLCSYTDISGRKLGLLLPCIGGAVRGILFVIVIYCKAPVSYLFLGIAIEGLSGSHMSFHSSAYAYLADILDYDQRSLRFVGIQAVLYLATAIGNVAIGYCITWGYVHSFWYVTLMFVAAILYIVLLLPESRTIPEETPAFDVAKTFKQAVTVFRIYAANEDNPRTITKLRLLLAVITLDSIILLGRNDVEILYMMGMPYCWSSIVIGYFQGVQHLLKAVVAILGVPVLQLFVSDACMGMLGSVSGAASNLLMAVANTSFALWFVPGVGIGLAVITPLAGAMMSKSLTTDEQGALFASVGVIQAVVDIGSGSAFDIIYAETVHDASGSIFVIIAVLYVFSAAIFIYFCVVVGWKKEEAKPCLWSSVDDQETQL